MPLTIIVDDIANFSRPIEAVVNLCHPTPGEVGTGVDAAIHKKAGEKLRARLKELGRLKVGGIHYTDGYGLTNAHGEKVQSIFHVLGPLWHDGKMGEEEQLRRCYLDILQMACKRGVKSIAFPMISAGNRGFPEDVAYRIATDAFREFFDVPHDPEMQAYLVIFSGKIVEYCKRQQTDIVEVLDSKSVETVLQEVYTVPVETTYQRMMDSFLRWINLSGKIDQYLAEYPDENAFQTLTGLMDLQLRENPKFSEAQICKRGNLNPRHFSKNIRNHPKRNDPSSLIPKQSLLTYAVALGLNVSQTEKLLYRGQYLFSDRFPVDKVVMDCMKDGITDVHKINERLAEQGLTVLGSQEKKETEKV